MEMGKIWTAEVVGIGDFVGEGGVSIVVVCWVEKWGERAGTAQ